VKTLLVVEDDYGLRNLYSDILKGKYHLRFCDSVESAKPVIPCSDLIITSIELKGSLKGYDLLNYVADNHSSIPVVVVSSVFDSALVKKMPLFLNKPFKIADLENIIKLNLQ